MTATPAPRILRFAIPTSNLRESLSCGATATRDWSSSRVRSWTDWPSEEAEFGCPNSRGPRLHRSPRKTHPWPAARTVRLVSTFLLRSIDPPRSGNIPCCHAWNGRHVRFRRSETCGTRVPVTARTTQRFASKTMATASSRFVRASSIVAPCVLAPSSSSTNATYPPGTLIYTAVNLIWPVRCNHTEA
jgi:hypothetical protein